LVTDRQYRELLDRFEELSQKYAQMSREIAAIKMRLDIKSPERITDDNIVRKDITRYLFNGKQLNKRRLVLECIRQYIEDSGERNPETLKELFPDCLQGSMGIIKPAVEAERYSNATDHYFFNDEDVLNLKDGPYVVCKDWTVHNIQRFLDLMETLGYEIKLINR